MKGIKNILAGDIPQREFPTADLYLKKGLEINYKAIENGALKLMQDMGVNKIFLNIYYTETGTTEDASLLFEQKSLNFVKDLLIYWSNNGNDFEMEAYQKSVGIETDKELSDRRDIETPQNHTEYTEHTDIKKDV